MDFSIVKGRLQEAGVVCDSGLTETEIRVVEESFGFQFPPDLRAFLMFVLPRGKNWPNWRDVEDPEIGRMLNWPYEGICFDIQYNAFWAAGWGTKPATLLEAIQGNPVFSVYQTDIIYYGSNLWNYFQNEFGDDSGVAGYPIDGHPRRIEFWSDFVDGA